MATSVYFSGAVRSEQDLYEDLVTESIKVFGQDVVYIPRESLGEDALLNEEWSQFTQAYPVEMYLENTDGFDGDGNLLGKFGLEPSPKSQELTADQRNFSAFKNIMETGTESEKDIAKQIFTSGGKNVRPKEDFLIRISEQLAKDVTKSPEEIQASLPQYANIYDKIIGTVDSTPASQFEIKAPQGFNGTDQEWKILKDANPNLPNEEIIKNWNKYKKG